MDEIFEQDDQRIIRCYACDCWVRAHAAEVVMTGIRGDKELWCIGCIRSVDAHTLSLTQPELQDVSDLELEEGD